MTKLKKFFFDNFFFLKMIFAYNRSRRNIWIRNHLKMINNDAVVLDVGAGSSPYKMYLSHCKYFTHDFVQLDSFQIQDEEGYSKIDFISDILNIPVENSFADVILCTEVIEHVKHPNLVVKELNRILKKGGKLFLTAPLISGIHQAPYHFYGGFTKYWYMEILAENGFEIIELKENGDLFLSFMSFGHTIYKFFILKFNEEKKILHKLLFLLILVVLFIPFMILLTTFSWIFSKIFKVKDFTAGYHVYAIKK